MIATRADAGGGGSSAPAPTGGGPVFVVGSMRSGSTLLRLLLDSHPSLAIPAETGFMGALVAAKAVPNWKYGAQWYQRIGWTEEELDERLRRFYAGMFSRYAESQGKPRWGEKTPFHTSHMAAMARIFPSAVFVGIVRQPGAVASSLRSSFHYAFGDALSYWRATNLEMLRAGSGLGNRFVLCRYEDIVLEGEPVLRELVGWLGEQWSPAVLEHQRVQKDKGAPRLVDGSTSSRRAIDSRRATSWARTASESDRSALREAAGLAGFFGYDALNPDVRLPLLPPAAERRWLPDGNRLGERRAQWQDRVNFDERAPMLQVDADPEELAARLARLEAALARTRARRSVRLGMAVRTLQRGRSVGALRRAWQLVRSPGQ